jgi:cytochrome c-type biogenesis protein CcmE
MSEDEVIEDQIEKEIHELEVEPGSEDLETEPEDTEATEEPEDDIPRRPKKRFIATTKGKLLIVFVIIGVALAIGLWGAAPGDYLTLEEVVTNSDSYMGKEVEIIGKVGNWTGGLNFTLVGRSDENLTIFVIHEKEIPDGFAIGKDVVVKGKLQNGYDELTLLSDHPIQVGCPSKY